METFQNFIIDNYIVITIVTLILILALIGYIVDTKRSKDIKIKNLNDTNIPEVTETNIDNLQRD